ALMRRAPDFNPGMTDSPNTIGIYSYYGDQKSFSIKRLFSVLCYLLSVWLTELTKHAPDHKNLILPYERINKQ
ncbi:hypothetical protein KAU33_14065, partial [Candidatus Dependentiae bacterium]|nr:hypothetical protein [Candidatus Dependentiae bacterium]